MEAVWGLVGVLLGALGVYFIVVPGLRAKAKANEDAALAKVQLEERIRGLEETHAAKLKAYEDAAQNQKQAFASASAEALRQAQEDFAKIAEQVLKTHKEVAVGDIEKRQQAIDAMLKPFQDRLKDIDGHNREIEKERKGAYDSLIEQIKALGDQQNGLTKETNRLVKALQDPGSAGAWGEMLLERVIEMAGLQEHYVFDQQSTERSDDGDQRPDMIVNLPGGRKLIIDSKAPMRAYMEGLETPEDDMRANFFRAHAGKMHDHARELKKRDYSKRDGAPDFTVMFVPSESAFRVALEHRPGLIEECMECNVVIATPTTLLALLRAVNYGWQQDKLAQLAKEVQKDGALLYERIAKIVDDYNKLGKALKQAGNAYNDFGGSLESRVLPAARKFKDHGVQSNKEMAVIEPVEISPRQLTSDELTRQSTLGFVGHDGSALPTETEQNP